MPCYTSTWNQWRGKIWRCIMLKKQRRKCIYSLYGEVEMIYKIHDSRSFGAVYYDFRVNESTHRSINKVWDNNDSFLIEFAPSVRIEGKWSEMSWQIIIQRSQIYQSRTHNLDYFRSKHLMFYVSIYQEIRKTNLDFRWKISALYSRNFFCLMQNKTRTKKGLVSESCEQINYMTDMQNWIEYV